MENNSNMVGIAIKGIAVYFIIMPIIAVFIIALTNGINAIYHPWGLIPTGATSVGMKGFVDCFLTTFVAYTIFSLIIIIPALIFNIVLSRTATLKEYSFGFYFHNRLFLSITIISVVVILIYSIIKYIIL